jgi:hypothetical protein
MSSPAPPTRGSLDTRPLLPGAGFFGPVTETKQKIKNENFIVNSFEANLMHLVKREIGLKFKMLNEKMKNSEFSSP